MSPVDKNLPFVRPTRRAKRQSESDKCHRNQHHDCGGTVRLNHGQKAPCSCDCHNGAKREEGVKEEPRCRQ